LPTYQEFLICQKKAALALIRLEAEAREEQREARTPSKIGGESRLFEWGFTP